MSERVETALRNLARALGGEMAHVNRGESDDYIRGFNRGWDARDAGQPPDWRAEAPPRDPWRAAWRRGYLRGYAGGEEYGR